MLPSRIRLASAFLLVTTCGCATLSPTDRGVLGGGAIGAGTGAVIGSAVGNTGAGAVIGAGVGALTGGLVGNEIEQSEARQNARLAAATAPPPGPGPLSLEEIARMARERVADDVIVSQIRASRAVYRLTSDEIIWLKQSGVSDYVVREMQATATRVPAAMGPPMAGAAVVQPVYVVDPCPPPPPPIAFGFSYTRMGRCCR